MTDPWTAADGGAEAKRHAPATLRNREAIVAVLADWLPPAGRVLEVASGSGEHVVHFAAAFPHLRWQPSDPDPDALTSIAAWRSEAGLTNIAPPLCLDAAANDWPIGDADALLCINMVHISPWQATEGLFEGATRLLGGENRPLILYGPYFERGVESAPSNIAFDESLRSRNGEWGIRHTDELDNLGARHGFTRAARYEMPANNLMLVYRAN